MTINDIPTNELLVQLFVLYWVIKLGGYIAGHFLEIFK